MVVKDLLYPLFIFSYISFFRFSFQAAFYVEFDQKVVGDYLDYCTIRPPGCFSDDCANSRPNDRNCNPFNNANFVEKGYWINIVILIVQGLVYRVIAGYLFLKYSQDQDLPYEPFPELSTFEGLGERRSSSSSTGGDEDSSEISSLQQGPSQRLLEDEPLIDPKPISSDQFEALGLRGFEPLVDLSKSRDGRINDLLAYLAYEPPAENMREKEDQRKGLFAFLASQPMFELSTLEKDQNQHLLTDKDEDQDQLNVGIEEKVANKSKGNYHLNSSYAYIFRPSGRT